MSTSGAATRTHRELIAAADRANRAPGSGGYVPSQVKWENEGLCLQVGPFLFDEPFEDPDGKIRTVGGTMAHRHAEERREVASTVCQVCPVFNECAQQVFTNGETYGVWLGLSLFQRSRIAVKSATVGEAVEHARTRLFEHGKDLDGVDLSSERQFRVAYARQQAEVLAAKEVSLFEKARAKGTLRADRLSTVGESGQIAS